MVFLADSTAFGVRTVGSEVVACGKGISIQLKRLPFAEGFCFV